MFSYCADPSTLGGLTWLSCFLTTGVHLSFYLSFFKVLGLLAVTAPVALAFGFLGAMAARASFAPVSWLGKGYIADWDQPVRQGNDFIVCQAAKLPLGSSPEWMHETYAFGLAVITFAIVFGAFAANVLFGAMRAVPRAQLETGEAYGMTQRQTFWRILVPQMWVFALPGLSNLWMVLIKATPLLFLLGIEDIVYWARELGGTKTSKFTSYPHGDWRMWYFLALLIFYLLMTKVSETLLGRLMARLTRGQATAGGEAQRKAA